VVGAKAEEFYRVIDRGEAGLGGDLCRPLLDDAALHLDAAAAGAAGEVVMVRGGVALPVEGLPGLVADGVDGALLAEHLQVTVDRGKSHGLTASAELCVDFLSAAKAREPGQRGGDG
jgi:hypothetical protein